MGAAMHLRSQGDRSVTVFSARHSAQQAATCVGATRPRDYLNKENLNETRFTVNMLKFKLKLSIKKKFPFGVY